MTLGERRAAESAPAPGASALMRRRALRLRKQGSYRKAAVALTRLAGESNEARHWVALGAMWKRARRPGPALEALRQGMWLHKQSGALARARSVARLVLELDPADRSARRIVTP